MQPTISVVICTHNRPDDVIENTNALMPQCRGQPVEVIVVDSASAPNVASRLKMLPAVEGIKFLRLDEPGASLARNAGIERASGTWVGFLDDDAIPRGDWVEAALRRISLSGTQDAVIAGRVLPRWPSTVPAGGVEPCLLGPGWRMLLSIIDDNEVFRSTPLPIGVSANLLVRRTALQAIGGFPVLMGRVGNSLDSGEDPYVMDEIVKLGFESWYDGSICVEHKIHAARLTPQWIEERAWHQGVVSWRKLSSSRDRSMMVAKCALTLPILALLKRFDNVRSEYSIRFQHNLGLLQTQIRAMTETKAEPRARRGSFKMPASGIPTSRSTAE